METNINEKNDRESNAKLIKIISDIKEIAVNNQLTSSQLRYVLKAVRIKTDSVINKKDNTYLTPAEIEQLLNATKYLSPIHNLVISILLKTGLRLNELQNLILEDIDKSVGRIVVKSKSGIRYIPISADLIENIFAYTTPRISGPIFINNKTGKALTNNKLQQILTKSSTTANLGVIHAQKLRHTCVYNLVSNGSKIENIRSLMGWSNNTTADIYFKAI